MRVGIVGWGAIGRPMGDRLVAAGHEVTVLARRPETEAEARAQGRAFATTVAATVRDADVVLCVVLTDEQVGEVCTGPDGIVASMREGAVLVQHTTCDPSTVEGIAEAAAARGVRVLDAALSGGPPHIERGALTLWVGGDETVLDGLRPLLGAYASTIQPVGAVGNGQRIKLVNNALFVAQVGLAADAVRLAGVLGIDEAQVIAAVQHGSGTSSAFGILVHTGSVAGVAGLIGELMLKDLRTVEQLADHAGADLGILGTVLSSDSVLRTLGA